MLVFLVPIVLSFVVALVLSRWIDTPDPIWARLVRWVAIAVVATVAMLLAQRTMRRLLPLAALFSLTLVFPDETPSRFGLALRGMSAKQLEKKMAEIDTTDLGDTPTEAAESLLELVALLSRHDRMTRGHSERVRAYAVMIGEELGLADEELDRLRWAALIHDVGKLHVPSEILNKPEELSSAEFETIKQHTIAGRKMVAPLAPWLGTSANAVFEHHERWAGGGYPTGVPSERLALTSRIVSVADAFDVMTSARSYKAPMSAKAARAELQRCAGTQFDPEVVRAMMNISLGQLWRAMGPMSWVAQVGLFPRPVTQGGTAASVVLAALLSLLLTGLADAADRRADVVDGQAVDAGATTVPGADEDVPSTVSDDPTTSTSSTTTSTTTTSTTTTTTSTSIVPTTTVSSTTRPSTTRPRVLTTTPRRTTTTTRPPTTTRPTTTTRPPATTRPTTTIRPPVTTQPTTTTRPPTTTTSTTTTTTTTTTTSTTTTTTVPPGPDVFILASPGPGDQASQPLLELVSDRPAQNAALPNYDTDRNGDPGLTVIRSPGTMQTSDPAGVQVWRFPASYTTVDGAPSLELWVSPIGPPGPAQYLVRAGIFDCDVARSSCTRLVRETLAVDATAGIFEPVTFDLTLATNPYMVGPGRRLEIRFATVVNSSNDSWIAYDTAEAPARLTVTPLPPVPPPALFGGMDVPASGSGPGLLLVFLATTGMVGVLTARRSDPVGDGEPKPALRC